MSRRGQAPPLAGHSCPAQLPGRRAILLWTARPPVRIVPPLHPRRNPPQATGGAMRTAVLAILAALAVALPAQGQPSAVLAPPTDALPPPRPVAPVFPPRVREAPPAPE